MRLPTARGVARAGDPSDRNRAGAWLGEAASPGDTAVVAWGRPSIVLDAGLTSPYEHLWSLPARVRDPDLARFRAVLAGPDAPTWLVVVGRSLDSWAVDADVAEPLVERRYRDVAQVCGYRVLLLRGVDRAVPPTPACR